MAVEMTAGTAEAGDFDAVAGAWRLIEAAGVLGEPVVRFWVNPDPGWFWLEVTPECGGSLGGVWRASSTGEFLAASSGWSGMSRHDADAYRAWLGAAAGFARDGDDLVLRDDTGQTVARLSPAPDVGMEAHPRAAPRRVPDLAPGLSSALREQLLGAWQPILPAPGRLPWQNIEFRDDGWWRAFPGGNINWGRWTAGAPGTLLAIHPYAKTLAYCPVEEVDSWLLGVARAGFDDHQVLVLLADDGHEAQRLRRTEQPRTDATPPPDSR